MKNHSLVTEFKEYRANFVAGNWVNVGFAASIIVPAATLVLIFLVEKVTRQFLLPESGLSYLVFIPIWLSVNMGCRSSGFITSFFAAVCLQAASVSDPPVSALFVNFLTLAIVTQIFFSINLRIKKSQQEAETDSLTGILTRKAFSEKAISAMANCRLAQTSASVVLFDCNKFKEINDLYGHRIGDEALKVVGKALKRSSNSGDIVARLGGDEFVVFLNETDSIGANVFVSKVRRLLSELSQKLPTTVTVSAGIAYYPDESRDLETLIDIADQKMFKNKRDKTIVGETTAVVQATLDVRKPKAKRQA